MPFTSIFKAPDGSFFRYPMRGRTLKEEQASARQFDGSPEFGEYRYSRTVEQAPLELGKLYRFSPTMWQLRYQAIDEDMAGQFDYVKFCGGHQDICRLPVSCPATVDGLGLKAVTMLFFDINAARSNAFRDLCEKYVFAVSLSSGEPKLLGYSHAYADSPSVEIALTLVSD